jgi:hypothetical protein
MPNGNRKVFAARVTPLPAAEGPTHLGLMVAKARPETSKEQMTVVFSLALPDSAQADLQKMVAEGRTVSPAQLNKKYAADANDAKALTSWLKSQGFKIEKVSADRTSVYAQGTVEQIEKALNVNMVRVTKDGITYTAAQDAPSLPASVGKASVQSSDCSRSAARTNNSGSASASGVPAPVRGRAAPPPKAQAPARKQGQPTKSRFQRISRVGNISPMAPTVSLSPARARPSRS